MSDDIPLIFPPIVLYNTTTLILDLCLTLTNLF